MPAAAKAKPRRVAPTPTPRAVEGWRRITYPATLKAEAPGLALLALALIVNAILLWPEIRIERVPVNDLSFHIAASQRLTQSLTTGDSLLDPWVSQWAAGYPLWHFYQPLPHMVAGLWLVITNRFASAPASFAVLYYLLLVVLPASTYLGARLFGLKPLAAGFASILIISVSEVGDLSRYGLSYGAYVRRGSGLYTQLMSHDLLMPALGVANYSLNTGRKRILAACLVALTALSHVVFGYAAIVTVAIMAMVGPRGARSRRVVRAASILIPAMILLAWFVVPMLLASGEANRCRWDDVWKFDSWGARNIFDTLLSGRFFDEDRLPVMTSMLALSSLLALYRWNRPMPRRLLVLSAVWLMIFFGRATWGYFMLALGLPRTFHVSRFESVFELFAILLMAWALAKTVTVAWSVGYAGKVASAMALGAIALVIFTERASFLQLNNIWGDQSLDEYARERSDIDAALTDIRTILRDRPGRVWSGPTGGWAAHFQIAKTQPYSFLSLAGFDELSFLYHSLSWSSDLTAELQEQDPYQVQLFAVRAVLAPITQPVPSFYKLRGVHGDLAVYEAADEGYFGLVDIGARYAGPLTTVLNRDWGWIQAPAMRAGAMVALGGDIKGLPEWTFYHTLPPLDPRFSTARGEVISESKNDETYSARLAVLRPCYALLKITYFPGMQATVDGQPAQIFRVYPNFCAIPVPPGEHQIEVRYHPGPLKAILLVAGIILVGFIAQAMRRPDFAAMERRLIARLAELAAPWATPRARTALALSVLFVLAMRPLFHGDLIDGHHALEYPPRLVEMSRALTDQFPPVWAPDLSSGHGQPLFEFSPPLLYMVALPFFKAGFLIANSLQFGLAFLFAFGTLAMYRIARRYGASRVTAIAVTGTWLFSPYIMLDLYVRAAMTEAAALAILPLALYGTLLALDHRSIAPVGLGAFTVALVMLASSGVALLFIPVLAMLILSRAFISRAPVANVLAGAMAWLGGLSLSAFFWLPALLEKDYVKTYHLTSDWMANFISPLQLVWGRWGFGSSIPSAIDSISFSSGIPHLLLGVCGFVLLYTQTRKMGHAARQDLVDMSVFAIAAIGGAFLAFESSSPIWTNVHTLQYLQQPWRALFLPALFLPLFALYAFQRIGSQFAAAALVALVLLNIGHTQPKGIQTYDDPYYYADSIARLGLTATSNDEYAPRTAHQSQGFQTYLLKGVNSTPLITNLGVSSNGQSFKVDASEPALLQDSVFDYPGWTVFVDDRKVASSSAPDTGLLTFNLPAGTHNVSVELRPTPARRLSYYLSIATGALISLMLIFTLFTTRTGDKPVARATKPGSRKRPRR